jgi:hypothetical protein
MGAGGVCKHAAGGKIKGGRLKAERKRRMDEPLHTDKKRKGYY